MKEFETTSITCEITLEFWPGFSDSKGRLETIQYLVKAFNEMTQNVGIMDGADKHTKISRTVTQ